MVTSPRRHHRCPPCGRTSVDAVIATSPCSTWNHHFRGQRTWRTGRTGGTGRPGVTRGGRRHHPHHRTEGPLFHVERRHTRRPPSSTWNTPGRSSCRRRGRQGALLRRSTADRARTAGLTPHGRSPACHAKRPTRPRSVPRGTRARSPQHAMSVSGWDPEQLTFQRLSRSRGVPSRVFHVKRPVTRSSSTWNPVQALRRRLGTPRQPREPTGAAEWSGGPGSGSGPGIMDRTGDRGTQGIVSWGHHERVRAVPRGTLDDP